MRNLFTAAAIAATFTFAAAGAVQAADQQVSVPVFKAELLSATGAIDLNQRIAAKAEAYCRAHPIGLTVASCTRDISDALQAQANVRRQAMMSTPNTYAQARR
jgi:UrcA family protein